MPNTIYLVIIYLAIVNLIAIFMTILDKYRAQKHQWRIPEATLLLVSAFGGSVAMYLTMRLIRHKTRHAKFMVGIPAILLLQIAAIVAILYAFYFK